MSGGRGTSDFLIESLAASIADSLEAMTGARPGAEWSEAGGAPASDEMLWWEQHFQILNGPALWLGAPRETWEELGSRTLRAAGLEDVSTEDSRNTWLEILNQAFSSVARLAGQKIGQEVTSGEGLERQPRKVDVWFQIVLTCDRPLAPLWAAASPEFLDRMNRTAPAHPPALEEPIEPPRSPERNTPQASRTMDLLLDVELPVSISFGRSRVPLKDLLKLTTGSIVELNRAVNEPVEVLVNDSLIARGEVVVVEGNYAVRIQQIASLQDRLRSL